MRCDEKIRDVAMRKNDTEILAVVARDIVAAEAHYHRECYREYTRQGTSAQFSTMDEPDGDSDDLAYASAEKQAFKNLFDYIRNEVFTNPSVLVQADLMHKLFAWMTCDGGVKEIRLSTKTHFGRKLKQEFKNSINMIDDGYGKVLVYFDSLTREMLVRENANLKKKLADLEKCRDGTDEILQRTARLIRSDVKSQENYQSWPPLPAELEQYKSVVPESLKSFLNYLLPGKNERVGRLVDSIGVDMVYGISHARVKSAKHILLAFAVKTLTGNVELIQALNRFGHSISYSQVEEIDTALCLYKLARESQSSVVLPEQVKQYVPTTLAWDNIDRLEETLTGGGTSHRVNGIAVQERVFGPDLPKEKVVIPKNKQRSISVPQPSLPVYPAGTRRGPQSRVYVEVSSDTLEGAQMKNFLWVICRLHNASHQTTPSWTGFNILASSNVNVSRSVVSYLPTINAPATQLTTVNEVLQQTKSIMQTLNLNGIVVVFDQALYAKATEILWKHQLEFKNIVPRLGVFHTICMFLGVIGKRFRDAGLKDICIESGVIAEGSVAGVLDGHRYNRALRFHKILYEALLRLSWAQFPQWLEDNNWDKSDLLETLSDELGILSQGISSVSVRESMDSQLFSNVYDLFCQFQDHLKHRCGPLASFWMSYLEMVELALNMVRASREGDWNLHLASVQAMIPWCFAYDNLNYARSLTAYLSEMSHVQLEQPEVHDYLSNGGFSAQLGDKNTFGRVPIDQTLEETVNRDTQTPGGTKGFSLKPGAIARYYINAEFRSTYLRTLRNSLGLDQNAFSHKDLGQNRISKDEQDVAAVVDLLESSWINPFSSEAAEDLVSLSTGKAAPDDIAKDLAHARAIGVDAHRKFYAERVCSDPPVKEFHSPLKKQQLKTFSSLQAKKKSYKAGNKEVILKADNRIFAQMILVAQSRQLSLLDVFRHPLGPLPWALATPEGDIRKNCKSTLSKQLLKYPCTVDELPINSACIIDAMALVHKLKGDGKTFVELAAQALSVVLAEGVRSNRIDLIFDLYKDDSIKQMERSRRGAETGIQVKQIAPGHRIQQWRNFLKSPENKNSLGPFFVKEWSKETAMERLQDKALLVTVQEECVKLTRHGIEKMSGLSSTQEEADTRMFLHAAHAAKEGWNSVLIVSDDTDVLVLSLAISQTLSCQILQKTGNLTRTNYIDISKLVAAVGPGLCKALPGMHAFTGCDSVSAFTGHGKVSAIKLLQKNEHFCDAFQKLGDEWLMTPELLKLLEEFTCRLYNSKSSITEVNELRYALFCSKKGIDSWQLPPCSDSLKKHCARANYQSAIWKRCLENDPEVPSPVGHGWLRENQDGNLKLSIDWFEVPTAPQAVLELLSCSCRRDCKPPSCQCASNKLVCTDLCHTRSCSNQRDDFSDEETLHNDENDVDDEESYDSDEWD